MQCPQCGSLNAPGQDVCSRCGSPLMPVGGNFQDSRLWGNNRARNGSDASMGDNAPIDGVWREEWPALDSTGAPAPTAVPPWLANPGSAPSAPTSPSAPYTNGSPSRLGEHWPTPANTPASGPFSANFPSQYPAYHGNGSGQLDHRSAPQPPMFMVNPPDVYPPSAPNMGLAPYNAPAMPAPPAGQQALTLTPVLNPGMALKNGRYRIIQPYISGSAGGDTEPPLMIATDTDFGSQRVLVQELMLGMMHPEDAEYVRRDISERLERLSQVAGVAHLRDSFVEQRRYFLVFELPSGDRLIDRMQRSRGPLSETTVIGVVMQVLEVLGTLQNSPVPVLHGNINPANIVLRPGGQVALVGFSPTLLSYPTGQVAHGPAGSLSHYSAPEQARGVADIRSDLYAICAVMHHAVTGVEPVGRLFPLARHANPAVSLELEDILSQGLRPSPGQRYQTPEALYQTLAPLASGKRLTHVDEELDPNSPTGLRPLRDAQGRLMGPRQRLTQNPLFFVGIVLLLVALLGGGVLYAMQPHNTTPTTPATTITSAFAPYYQSKGIGLSGGEFVFDTQQPDFALKQKGALAIGVGDVRGALAAYRSAIVSEPSDVEALIYAADLQILADHSPYVTLIAGVAFDNPATGSALGSADTDAARYELQGIYLAQKRFNSAPMTPGHYRMRVLILNSGESPSDAQLASTLMLDQIHAGNVQHIVGIVGWPASNQTRLAMAALGASGLPVISPTASANNLEDTAANFFAMGPSDAQQAVDLANAAATTLQAHRVLVAVDPSEQENSDSANNFSNQVILNFSATTTILGRVSYEASSLQDASGFRAVADAAISQNADLIYLVGDQRAAIFLADEVDARASQTFHQPPHILVGTQSQMTPFFGVGTDPAALAARANSGSLALLYVATLASTSHWQALNINAPDVRAFSDNFSALFGGVWGTGGLALPSSLAILSYDASNMLLAALGDDVQVKGNNVTVPTSQQLTIALRQFTVQHPFVGLGGAVGFSNSVHQPNKALGLFMLLPIPNAPDNAPVVQLQLTTVIGGKPVFCGQSACQPY